MKKINVTSLVAMLLLIPFIAVSAYSAEIKSPNGQIVLNFDLQEIDELTDCPVYGVTYRGKALLDASPLGFTLNDGSSLKDNFSVLSAEESSHNNVWKPVYGKRSVIRNHYNELVVKLAHESTPKGALEIVFRCYDSGVALRYRIPKGSYPGDQISIKQENTAFRFFDDHTAWVTSAPQGIYREKPISEMGSGISRPLTIKVDDYTYVAVAEAALVNFARAQLSRSEENPYEMVTELGSEVQSELPLTTPWRVLMIASSPGELLENNDIILNLNEPSKIKDPSWIRPGQSIREVTNTTEGGKACADFAHTHNMEYVHFDTGWYGAEFDSASNPMTVASGRVRKYPNQDVFMNIDLDLQEVIEYAKTRDVGVIVYVNRVALENYSLEEMFSTYHDWGLAGVKMGFVRVGPQKWTQWLHRAVRLAAKYELMVDIHDEYRPTGYSRTYPNLMTQEGINGDEGTPETEQSLTTLFTRMLAGAADNTICYYTSRVDEKWSHAHQLAKAICFYSPLTWLYWYDRPSLSPQEAIGTPGKGIIGNEPELEFFNQAPTVWDETKVIHGSIGNYAVIARQSGENWFIGGLNSKKARSFKVALNFLSPDKEYVAHIYRDDETVDTRTHVAIDRKLVNANTVLDISMPANGGQAVRIVPAQLGDDFPPYNDE